MAEPSDGDRRQGPASFGLGETAPDSVWLPDLECIGSALANDRTDLAHGFGSYLSALSFVLAFLDTWGEEEVGVVAACRGRQAARNGRVTSVGAFHLN